MPEFVRATIVRTEGSTYRKAGASLCVNSDGSVSGLLSGGCLEADLSEHAKLVFRDRKTRLIQYDMRSTQDLISGLGLGCDGFVEVYLYIDFTERVNADLDVLRVESGLDGEKVFQFEEDFKGSALNCRRQQKSFLESPYFFHHRPSSPKILILGAGPDAIPVAKTVKQLNWDCFVYDHREAFLEAEDFRNCELICQRPEKVQDHIEMSPNAIVIMSHHFEADAYYLKFALRTEASYIGLLGPHQRRKKLFDQLKMSQNDWGERLHSPIGLDLGADTPEEIALSIVSEILMHLRQKTAKSLRTKQGSIH